MQELCNDLRTASRIAGAFDYNCEYFFNEITSTRFFNQTFLILQTCGLASRLQGNGKKSSIDELNVKGYSGRAIVQ